MPSQGSSEWIAKHNHKIRDYMNKYSMVSIAVVSSIILSACGGGSSINEPGIGQALAIETENVNFDFNFSALLDLSLIHI